MHRGHRVRAQLARRRERVGDRPPQSTADVAPYRMREAEGDVGLVAIHDHRREQTIQRVPYRDVGGQSRECREDPRPVLGDVAAVQPQALPADSDRGVRIHLLEGALRKVRILAQLAVELVVDGEDQLRGRVDACGGVRAQCQAGVRLLHRRFALDQHPGSSAAVAQRRRDGVDRQLNAFADPRIVSRRRDGA